MLNKLMCISCQTMVRGATKQANYCFDKRKHRVDLSAVGTQFFEPVCNKVSTRSATYETKAHANNEDATSPMPAISYIFSPISIPRNRLYFLLRASKSMKRQLHGGNENSDYSHVVAANTAQQCAAKERS